MAKTTARNSLVGYNLPLWSAGWFHKCPMILAAAAIVASFGSNLQAASSQSRPSVNERVEVFSSAEETATLIETVSDGASLTPLAEIMGAGGVKWFMIKTPAGNVGWIKAGENSAARQVDGHFRALPKESTSISPAGNSPDSLVKTSSQGKATIPIQVRGRHIIVAVTFNDSVTGNLVLDTGAGQTMIPKRI